MSLAQEYTRNFNLGMLPGEVSAPQDAKRGTCIPQFFTMSVKDESASAVGLPRYREIEMVQFIIPGDKHNMPERKVKEIDKVQYAKQYEAFKKGLEQAADGTRLEDWPVLHRSMILQLKAQNIFTVEAIAGLSDDQLRAIGMGARTLRNHAQAFLETCKTGQVPAQLVAENEALKNQVNLLMSQIGALSQKFENMAVKAGEKLEDMANPAFEARIAAKSVTGVSASVSIPTNYRQQGFGKLKEMITEFTPIVPRNKEEALEMIEEYLAKSKALS